MSKSATTLTHSQVAVLGERHLRGTRKCRIVLREKGGYEVADVIGWANWSILLEVKVSVQDFHADRGKPRTQEGRGLGTERWYLTPKGLLAGLDFKRLRPDWGLLEIWGGRVRRIIEAPVRHHHDDWNEQRILVSRCFEWEQLIRLYFPDEPTNSWVEKCQLFNRAKRALRFEATRHTAAPEMPQEGTTP